MTKDGIPDNRKQELSAIAFFEKSAGNRKLRREKRSEMKSGQSILRLCVPVLLLAASCTNHEAARKMDAVESYINARPDSALSVLQGMEAADLRTRAQKARYALLHTMAQDKSYGTVTLEQLRPAIAWYSRRGTPDERMKTLYYQGSIAQKNRDREAAAVLYARAEEYAGKVRDEHALGLLYLAQATVYESAHNLEKAKEYTEKGLRLYSETGDPMKDAVQGQLAIVCFRMKEWEAADSLFRQGLAATSSNRYAQSIFLSNYAQMKVLQPAPDPEAALALLDRKAQELGTPLSNQDMGAYAYALILAGRGEDAKGLLEELEIRSETYPLNIRPWLSLCAQASGDYRRAYELLSAAHISTEEEILRVLSDSVTGAISEYHEDRAERRRVRYRSEIASGIIVVLALALAWVLTLMRKRRIEEDRARIFEICSALEREADESASNTLDLRQQLEHFRGVARKEQVMRFRQAGRLRSSLWRIEQMGLPGWIKGDPSLAAVKEELSYIYDIEDSGERLIRRLDKELDGLILPLMEALNLKTESDRLFLCCCILDLPADLVSARFGITVNNARVRRSRLRERIARLDNPDYDVLFGISR